VALASWETPNTVMTGGSVSVMGAGGNGVVAVAVFV
jgi:hypothetical protein